MIPAGSPVGSAPGGAPQAQTPPTRTPRTDLPDQRLAPNAVPHCTVFCDTEFTRLGRGALLLSVGMVADTTGPDEFYGEVTDTARLAAAGSFARAAVTPQFGKVPGAGCSYHQLGVRIAEFLQAVLQHGPFGTTARIAFESDCDWTLIVRAVSRSCPHAWRILAPRLAPANVYNMPGFAAGERAAQAYFHSQATAVISRHHALCDARALRIACRAADAEARALRPVLGTEPSGPEPPRPPSADRPRHPGVTRPPAARTPAAAAVNSTAVPKATGAPSRSQHD